jgi:hypothetical protein
MHIRRMKLVIYNYEHDALMMEAVRTSETSVYFNETAWCSIPEGYCIHIRRRENMKSHKFTIA